MLQKKQTVPLLKFSLNDNPEVRHYFRASLPITQSDHQIWFSITL